MHTNRNCSALAGYAFFVGDYFIKIPYFDVTNLTTHTVKMVEKDIELHIQSLEKDNQSLEKDIQRSTQLLEELDKMLTDSRPEAKKLKLDFHDDILKKGHDLQVKQGALKTMKGDHLAMKGAFQAEMSTPLGTHILREKIMLKRQYLLPVAHSSHNFPTILSYK